MEKFPGSLFFFDTASLQNKVLASREYELPVFISNQFLRTNPDPSWRRQILRHAGRYRFYYKCAKRRQTQPEPEPPQCVRKTCTGRFKGQSADLSLAPNRFNLTDGNVATIIGRSTGTKGPYACFTGKRDDSSMIGKLAPPKFKGSSKMFYDIPNGMDRLNNPRDAFKMKIRHGSRFDLLPSSRFMLADLTLCPKDPTQPGPCDCQPGIIISKKSKFRRPKEPSHFFPRSCVPQNERFWVRMPFYPGPGRYTPEPIACPCPCGTSYIEERERLLQLSRLRQSERVPVRLNMRKCPPPYIRNIPGRGHTFVFRSNVKRLLAKRTFKALETRQAKQPTMGHDAKYLQMITHPYRKTISYPVFDLKTIQMRPGKLRFNSVERPALRIKMRQNRRVAFMSCCPRWPISHLAPVLLTSNKKKAVKHVSPHIKQIIPLKRFPGDSIPPAERLRILPKRYQLHMPTVDRSNKMRNTFEPLPPARILLQDKLTIDKEQLVRMSAPLDPEKFYKAEVLALRLPKLPLAPTPPLQEEDSGSM